MLVTDIVNEGIVEEKDILRVDGIIAVSWAQPRSPGCSLNQIGDTQPVSVSSSFGERSRQLGGMFRFEFHSRLGSFS